MSTRVRVRGRCRGDGKLYTLIEVPALEHGVTLRASCWIGSTEVPCGLVELGANEYVFVAADFVVSQHAVIFQADAMGRTCSLAELAVNPAWFAGVSKLNGVLRKTLCSRIRNIDSSGANREIAFTCETLIPRLNGFVARGLIEDNPKRPVKEIVAFDPRGNELSRSRMFLNSHDGFVSGGGRPDKLLYSIDVPSELDGLCLAAVDESGAFFDAFKAFKKKPYKKLVKACVNDCIDAAADSQYPNWLASRRLTAAAAELQRREARHLEGPLFSVIVPLYKTPLDFFRDMADSVLAQTYTRWELVLVNASPEDSELRGLVAAYAERDDRIRCIEIERNLGITENTNVGIEVAQGDYLCFFDHDDVLEPDILFEYATAIKADPAIDLLYCDEDKLLPNGWFAAPTFKPDFSLDMLRDNNYVCHLLTVRRSAYEAIEPSGPELDGAQDHAMALKVSELGGHIHHVPKVLYHWRISETSTAGNADSKPYATEAGIRAVQQHLDRLGIAAKVSNSHGRAFRYRVDYLQESPAKVSVVVPTRGDSVMLSRLLSIFDSLEYPKWELILIAPSDCAASVSSLVQERGFVDACRVVSMASPFNMARWLNVGASNSTGDCLLFMHDDVFPGEKDWFSVLAGFAMRGDVGAVGTMTCFEDGVIQQAGLSFVRDTIIKLSSGTHRSLPGYLFYPLTVRNVAAVDGACLATSRVAFDRVGGFDESFSSAYADIDYCFAVARAGLRVTYTPEAWMCHNCTTDLQYGYDSSPRATRYVDKALLLEKWAMVLAEGDAFFSENFSNVPLNAEGYKM